MQKLPLSQQRTDSYSTRKQWKRWNVCMRYKSLEKIAGDWNEINRAVCLCLEFSTQHSPFLSVLLFSKSVWFLAAAGPLLAGVGVLCSYWPTTTFDQVSCKLVSWAYAHGILKCIVQLSFDIYLFNWYPALSQPWRSYQGGGRRGAAGGTAKSQWKPDSLFKTNLILCLKKIRENVVDGTEQAEFLTAGGAQ